MRRILIVVVLFAASGTASYLIWHARKSAPPAPVTRRGSGGDTATASARHDAKPPARPILPRHVDGDPDAGATPSDPSPPPPSGPSQSFEQEQRDATWAADTERELTLRMKRVIAGLAKHGADVDIDGIECRRTLCRIAIHAASDAALSRLYGALETTEGLYGWADTVLLTRIDIGADGKLTTAALAQFDRE